MADDALTGRDRAVALDRADPLARFRDAVVPTDPGVVYLDGNSLGMLPRRTRDRLIGFLDEEWGRELVRGWHHWYDLPGQVGDLLGRELIGAAEGQVLVCDSLSVNLFKLASAAMDVRPGRTVIVTDTGNFPSDRYVLEGVAQARGGRVRWIDTDPVLGVTPELLMDALGDDVALVALSMVDYRSAALADVATMTRQTHQAGALMLWDLAHAAGAVPVQLDAVGVDFAVGCTYKYLNAGPGSPGFLYVRDELQEMLGTPIRGWWGQDEMFAMERPYRPRDGVARFLAGSPPVPGLIAVQEGVALLAEAGIDRLRDKSRALTDYVVELSDAWLEPLGFTVASPREADHRGGHVVLSHPDAYRIGTALVERAKVVPDLRPPDLIRIGPAPLTTSFGEVWEGLRRLRDLVQAGDYLSAAPSPGRVT